jgi:hypothetical protein
MKLAARSKKMEKWLSLSYSRNKWCPFNTKSILIANYIRIITILLTNKIQMHLWQSLHATRQIIIIFKETIYSRIKILTICQNSMWKTKNLFLTSMLTKSPSKMLKWIINFHPEINNKLNNMIQNQFKN